MELVVVSVTVIVEGLVGVVVGPLQFSVTKRKITC